MRITKQDYEPLVPVSEFGVAMMTSAELDAWATVAGVTLHRDYADRMAVSIPDAYRLAEVRRKAEREYHEANSRRHVEHAAAVAELEARMTKAFEEARSEASARYRAMAAPGNVYAISAGEVRAEIVNEALQAARAVWDAAPRHVSADVTSVQYVENDTFMSIDLNVVLPRGVHQQLVADALWRANR
jgi:hypothetical protein